MLVSTALWAPFVLLTIRYFFYWNEHLYVQSSSLFLHFTSEPFRCRYMNRSLPPPTAQEEKKICSIEVKQNGKRQNNNWSVVRTEAGCCYEDNKRAVGRNCCWIVCIESHLSTAHTNTFYMVGTCGKLQQRCWPTNRINRLAFEWKDNGNRVW